MFEVLTVTAGIGLQLRLTSDGKITVYGKGTSLLATGATVLAADTWYRVSVYCGSGASAAWAVRIDGAVEVSGASSDLANGNRGYIRLGKYSNKNGKDVDYFFDDVCCSDSEYPGEGKVVRMDADGDSAVYTDWTRNTGSYDWQCVDQVPPVYDDSYYINSSINGECSCVTLETAAAAGVDNSIKAVKAFAIVRDVGGVSSVRLRTKTGGNDDTDASDPGATYVARGKVYNVDPYDSAPWTTAKLAALEVGVVNNADVEVRCTDLWAMVWCGPVYGAAVLSGTGSVKAGSTAIVEARISSDVHEGELFPMAPELLTNTNYADLGTKWVGAWKHIGGWWYWDSVKVPQAADLKVAKLGLLAWCSDSSAVTLWIRVVNQDNAGVLVDWADYLARPVFDLIQWVPDAWTVETWYWSLDIASTIKKILKRSGWASGNGIVMSILATDTEYASERRSWERGGKADGAAVLHLEWSDYLTCADLSGSGTVTVAGRCTVSAKAVLSGSGAVAAAGQTPKLGAAALAGSGEVTVVGTVTAGFLMDAAVLAGEGAVVAAGGRIVQGAAALSGSGAITAAGQRTECGAAALSGSGVATAAGRCTIPASAVLAGAGAVNATGVRTLQGQSAPAGAGAVSVVGRITWGAAAVISAEGTVAAAAILLRFLTPDSVESFCGEDVGAEAAKSIDDNTGDYWRHSATEGHWIIYDLATAQAIFKIRIYQSAVAAERWGG